MAVDRCAHRASVALAALLPLCACGGAPASRSAGSACLEDGDVRALVAGREAAIDAVQRAGARGARATALVERRCLGRSYRRGAYVILVSRDRETGAVAAASFERAAGEAIASPACLERAATRAAALIPRGAQLVA